MNMEEYGGMGLGPPLTLGSSSSSFLSSFLGRGSVFAFLLTELDEDEGKKEGKKERKEERLPRLTIKDKNVLQSIILLVTHNFNAQSENKESQIVIFPYS